MAMFQIENLRVSVSAREILDGLPLTVKAANEACTA
jgi:Fe-S cluster assembly ATPase SufC